MINGFVYFRTKFFEAIEQRAVEKIFYKQPRFKELDALLSDAYLGSSGYEISKAYLTKKGAKDVYTYGETPLTTMAQIAESFGITSKDRVIEMGAGRGRGALFLGEYVGAQVKGVELIPRFVEIFQETVSSDRVEMIQGDMFTLDFSWATVIYLFGTMLGEEQIKELAARFPKGTKILTVSYPLEEYAPEYRVEGQLVVRFPWGKTEIYSNVSK